jgi:hypothetical protein
MSKKNRKSYTFFCFLLSVCCLFAACGEDEQCRQNMYVRMNVKFYKSVIDSTGVQKNSSASFALTAKGEGIDSLIVDNETRNFVALPLNKSDSHSTFILTLNDTVERLTVWHSNTEEYLSFECGCLTAFKIDSVKLYEQFIDSSSVINVDVNTRNAENIQLYRHYDNRK